MDDRKMIANSFIAEGHPIGLVLEITGVPRSSYYYKPKDTPGKRGARKSEYTLTAEGELVPNSQVLEDIKTVLAEEFVDYGYLKTTHYLRQEKRYIINPKKVYRLMSEEGLLNKVVRRKKSRRNWVKELLPPAEQAFDYLEFDIKYVYVAGLNRNALLLTVIDVKSRWVLAQYTDWQLKQDNVMDLFDQIFEVYPLPKHFYVRNDNGSQFEAKRVQEYFEARGVTQEFCKPATPEQNAHIESYHSILEKVVCQQYEFDSFKEMRDTLNRFVKFYNFKRIHSGVDYKSPYRYLLESDINMNLYNLEKVLDCASCKNSVVQTRTTQNELT